MKFPQLLKIAFCIIFLLLYLTEKNAFSQGYGINNRAKIYAQHYSDSVVLKSDNQLSIPVTVRLSLKLDNLTTDTTISDFIIPAESKEQHLAVLKRINTAKPYQCTLSWRITPGDTSKTPDLSYSYGLPYFKGQSYPITQGPFGSFSHKNVYAYDFDMPIGTPVCAAREGIIAFIKNDSDKGGADKKYTHDANFVSIYHEDGTLGNYYHLNKSTLALKEGEYVKKGQIIGYSGNTGYADGPHLHFEVTQPTIQTSAKKWIPFKWEFPVEEALSTNLGETELHRK